MILPFVDRWRKRRSPYRVLLPARLLMWAGVGAITWKWRTIALYTSWWTWIAALALFAAGIWLYVHSASEFTPAQLGGLPEVRRMHADRRLVTTGIRSRVRHPVYLAHLCEMLAWSLGTGLVVCFWLTAFAVATGAVMIRMEEAELEQRFGSSYREYKNAVPAILPLLTKSQQ